MRDPGAESTTSTGIRMRVHRALSENGQRSREQRLDPQQLRFFPGPSATIFATVTSQPAEKSGEEGLRWDPLLKR